MVSEEETTQAYMFINAVNNRDTQAIESYNIRNIRSVEILYSLTETMLFDVFFEGKLVPRHIAHEAVDNYEHNVCRVLVNEYYYYDILMMIYESDEDNYHFFKEIIEMIDFPPDVIDHVATRTYNDKRFEILDLLMGKDKELVNRLNLNIDDLFIEVCANEHEDDIFDIPEIYPNIYTLN